MSRSDLERATDAWATVYAGLTPEEIGRRVQAFTTLVRGIEANGAVTPDEFTRETRLDSKQTGDLFASLAAMGLEFDEAGRIVGAALTTRETPHSVVFRGKQLYAWCALDTLFIPGLLGGPAEVESTCPVSKEPIRLSVAPDGLTSASPLGAALSVVLPGVGSSGATTGPASPT